MKTALAGAATVVINPPLGSSIPGYFHDRRVSGVHDDVWARAVVIEAPEPLALVALDVIGLQRETVRAVRRRVEEEVGIAGERVLLAATHTHTGPPTYGAFATGEGEEYLAGLVEWCVEAVREARERVQPAELGIATTEVPGLAFNRRYWMQDGTVRTNPGIGNPEVVRTAGPVRETMTVLALRPVGGHPYTVLVNFALHLDTVGGTEISADYPGYLTQALQETLGSDTVVLFLNGACGDINHWNVLGGQAVEEFADEVGFMRGGKDPGYTERAGRTLARAALELMTGMEWQAEWTVAEAHEMVRAGLRRPSEEQLAEARRLTTGKDPGQLETVEELYAEQALQVAALPEDEVELEVQALRIGPAALVGIPNEVFTELGQLLEADSPFAETLVVELANGCEGYLPTARAFAEGGYETMLALSSKLAPETGEAVVAVATGLLKRLAEQ